MDGALGRNPAGSSGFGVRRAGVLAGLAAALAVSACGVKNLPQAPGSDAPPVAVVEEQRASDAELFGRSRPVDAIGSRAITEVDDDETVSAAEVARNKNARNRRFFLDPLLN